MQGRFGQLQVGDFDGDRAAPATAVRQRQGEMRRPPIDHFSSAAGCAAFHLDIMDWLARCDDPLEHRAVLLEVLQVEFLEGLADDAAGIEPKIVRQGAAGLEIAKLVVADVENHRRGAEEGIQRGLALAQVLQGLPAPLLARLQGLVHPLLLGRLPPQVFQLEDQLLLALVQVSHGRPFHGLQYRSARKSNASSRPFQRIHSVSAMACRSSLRNFGTSVRGSYSSPGCERVSMGT